MPKAVIFLGDGMADEPLPELNGKTPLEAAETPAMDAIAAEGVNGLFLTLPGGLPTSSDVANMSVLGFYPERNYPGRGPIEAVSQGIRLAPDDVAWRCNLVTVSPEGVLKDFSAGHIDNGTAARLMRLLEEKLGDEKVTFHTGVSYRNLLVLHGAEFSDAVEYFKPDSSQDQPVADLPYTAKTPEAEHTVAFLNELRAKAHDVLASSGIVSGATDIWPWSPGHAPRLASFRERYGRTGAVVSAVDVIRGIGRATGMTVADVPGATGFLDTDYAGKVAAALKMLETHDLVYLHVEAVDECSHMGDLQLKLRAIREFDAKIVAPVRAALKGRTDVNFAVLPDHPVPIRLRKHTTTPVPVALCGPSFRPDRVTAFGEEEAKQGALGFRKGDELVRLLLGLEAL